MKKFDEVSNIDDVRQAAMGVYNGLLDGSIVFGTAKELTNALGKIINTAKVQIEYASLRKEKPDVPFLNVKPKK